jgi:hypothetical protein
MKSKHACIIDGTGHEHFAKYERKKSYLLDSIQLRELRLIYMCDKNGLGLHFGAISDMNSDRK